MAPPVFDVTRPDPARVQNSLEGGKDGYAADRDQAARLLAADPGIADRAREHLAFLDAAVRRAAAEAGIGQFVYLRCGFPRPGRDLHDAARAAAPGARVAYVDADPVVLSHARALLRGPGLAASGADPADPAGVWKDPDVLSVIDPDQPVGVVLGAVLNFAGEDEARQVCAGHIQAAAPGSWIAMSAVHYTDRVLYGKVMEVVSASGFRSVAVDGFRSFFGGLEPVHPGFTCARKWLGGIAGSPRRLPAYMLCGAAVKP